MGLLTNLKVFGLRDRSFSIVEHLLENKERHSGDIPASR